MKEIISQYAKTGLALLLLAALLALLVFVPVRGQIAQIARQEESNAETAWEEAAREGRAQTRPKIRLGDTPVYAGKILRLAEIFSTEGEGAESGFYVTDVTDQNNEKVLQDFTDLAPERDPESLDWEDGRLVGYDGGNQTVVFRQGGIYRITVRTGGSAYGKATFELMAGGGA